MEIMTKAGTSPETGTVNKSECGNKENENPSTGVANGESTTTTSAATCEPETLTTEGSLLDGVDEAFRPTVIAAATYNNSAWHQWYEKYGQYYFANVYYNQHQPYHQYPGSVSDNPLAATLQRPTVQPGQTPQTVREDDSSDFKCITDYGYPPPPKPPALPVPSPLVSPLASDDEDFDDENLIDLDAEIEEEITAIDALHIHDENHEVRPPSPVILEPPPAPPKFPFIVPPKISLLPPPPLMSVRLLPPMPKRGDKYAEFRTQEEELPWMIDGVHPALPEGLLSLMKPMHCRLCNIELSSKVVSLDHYRGRKHRLNVNFWLKRNKLPLAVSYPLPVSHRQQLKRAVQPQNPAPPPMQLPPPSRPLLPTPRIVPRRLEHPTFLWRDMSDPNLPDAVRSICGYMKCGVCDVNHFSATHASEHYKSALHRLMVDKWLERHNFVPNILHRPIPRPANLPPRPTLPMPRSRVYHPPSAPPPVAMSVPESHLEIIDIADSPPPSPLPVPGPSSASKSATPGLLKVPAGLRSYWAWIKKNKIGFYAQRTVRPSRFTSLPRTNTMTKTVRVLKPRPYYEAPIFKLKREDRD